VDIREYEDVEGKDRRIYCAMVDSMDQQIGRIIRALEKKNVKENTLIFFSSDNGGAAQSVNYPLKAGKGTPYEGGIRVPSFIVWPDGLKGGRSFDHPLHIVDLLPTLATLAYAETTKCLPFDGIDFWPALTGAARMPERYILHNVKDRGGRGSIRSGDWKLIVSRSEKTQEGIPLSNPGLVAELFNILQDASETDNLAKKNPELVETLWATLKKYGPEVVSAAPFIARVPEGWEAPADWSKVPE